MHLALLIMNTTDVWQCVHFRYGTLMNIEISAASGSVYTFLGLDHTDQNLMTNTSKVR
jgi:hypothetical protein